MRKLKSFSEINSFDELKISKEEQFKIGGGQALSTGDFCAYITDTCEWSCYDQQTDTYLDGTYYSSNYTTTNIDYDC